ncbi:MAG: hypothetical protein JST81_04725 [Bacteroidetes bacterium]|nr:hypothetical protein [Bacteroidota bacterium]
MHRLLFVLVFLTGYSISNSALAQDPGKARPKKVYCKCTVNGLPRGKFLSLTYGFHPQYSITTTDKSGNFNPPYNTRSIIKNNAHIEAKLKVPIINKPYLSIIAGFRYNKEQYKFSQPAINPLYRSLEDRDLRSIGVTLTILKPMLSNKFWILRLAGNFNGDYNSKTVSKTNYLKFSVSPALAWRKNDDFIYALGATYSYSFGRPLIFPTFGVNYNFNNRWSLESILPLFVKFRYGFNENFFWYNNLEVDGSSYRLDNTEASLSAYQSLHLHTSSLKYSTSLERQLVGWVWAGVQFGGIHNLSYNLTNSSSGRKDVIFKSRLRESFFGTISIYLVPPKKLYRKVAENL